MVQLLNVRSPLSFFATVLGRRAMTDIHQAGGIDHKLTEKTISPELAAVHELAMVHQQSPNTLHDDCSFLTREASELLYTSYGAPHGFYQRKQSSNQGTKYKLMRN